MCKILVTGAWIHLREFWINGQFHVNVETGDWKIKDVFPFSLWLKALK